jgi:DNA repair exonuclease SbcCD ATPase subunit
MDGVGHRQKTSIDYFLPLLNPDQTSEERTFEEDIKMRADDVNEGFKDEERGQLRKSRVEVAENYEERIDNAKGKLATLLQTMNNMFAERIPHDVEGYEKALKSLESHLKKLPKTKDSALQKALHTFGEQQTESLRGGVKERKGSPFPSKPQQDPARNTKFLEVWLHQVGTNDHN